MGLMAHLKQIPFPSQDFEMYFKALEKAGSGLFYSCLKKNFFFLNFKKTLEKAILNLLNYSCPYECLPCTVLFKEVIALPNRPRPSNQQHAHNGRQVLHYFF